MMKSVKHVLCVIGAFILAMVFLTTGNQLFLHAEENASSNDAEITAIDENEHPFEEYQEPEKNATALNDDAPSIDAAITDFSLWFHDEDGQPLSQVAVYWNGELDIWDLTPFGEDGKINFMVNNGDVITIEPISGKGYEFEPRSIVIDTVDLPLHDPTFEFTRKTVAEENDNKENEDRNLYFIFPGKTPEEEAEFLRTGTAVFYQGETAQIMLGSRQEDAILYYGINETDETHFIPYEGLIEVNEDTNFEINTVCAFSMTDYSDLAMKTSACIQVKFEGEAPNPAEPDEPTNPSDPQTPPEVSSDDQESTSKNPSDLNQSGNVNEETIMPLQQLAGGVNTADTSNITLWITLSTVTMGLCYITGIKARHPHS